MPQPTSRTFCPGFRFSRSTNSCWHKRFIPVFFFWGWGGGMFLRLHSYLGGAGPTCADVASPEHLLVAQDTTAGVLLVVQELLEGIESVLGVREAGNLLQQPTDLVWILLHLEKEEEKDMTKEDGNRERVEKREWADITHYFTHKVMINISGYLKILYLNIGLNFLFQHNVETELLAPLGPLCFNCWYHVAVLCISTVASGVEVPLWVTLVESYKLKQVLVLTFAKKKKRSAFAPLSSSSEWVRVS